MNDAADSRPALRLQLAGTPQAVPAGGAPHALAPLDAALLLWLCVEGPTPRARIVELLWPDADVDSARNSLRQRLFKLRRALGVGLGEGPELLALPAGCTHDLADATTLLGGLASPVGGAFGLWLGQQRERRQAQRRRALVEQGERAEAAHDWAGALEHARELLALEPLSEDAYRRLIRMHYLAGDRAAALLAFDACERMLKEEVGTTPSPQTLALLATVEASGASSPALPVRTAVPASVLRPPRMIGRDGERAALVRAHDAAEVAAVIGEAGLGKSRLLQEHLADHAGAACVSGRPGDAGVPFALLARLLRGVVADDEDRLPPMPTAVRRELVRLLPEFDAAAVPRPRAEAGAESLHRAVAELLAWRGVSLVVADDLHFADAASLEMIGRLVDEAGRADATPRWLLAWRPAEAGSPLRRLHDALVERARLSAVTLAPLHETAVAELVDSLGLPGVDGRALAPGLRQRTGGNPLFVLETLKQAWVERRLGELADARLLPRPQTVGRLIERRIAQLSTGALALARVAAIAGVDFSVGLAEHVLQAQALQFADSINELEAAQVLRGAAFAHDLVFEAVRDSVPPIVAAHTHGRVAGWLEGHDGEPARIARHWIEAGAAPRALPWLAQAAAAARLALRPADALAFLDEKSRIEEEAGDLAAAFASAAEACELYAWSPSGDAAADQRGGRLQRLAQDDAQRARALSLRAGVLVQRGRPGLALDAAREALRLALPLGDAALVAGVRQRLAEACIHADLGGEAVVHLEASLAWFDTCGDAEQRAAMHATLAVAYDNLGRLDDARPHHEVTLQLYRQVASLENLATASGNHACNRIDAGDLRSAESALAQDAQLLTAHDGDLAHQGSMLTTRALVLLALGRFGQALASAQGGVDAFRRIGSALLPRAQQRLALVWWQLGQHARALQQLDAAARGGVDESPVGRVTQAWLRWVCLRDAGGAGAGRAQRQALDAVLAGLDDGWRPDVLLPLRIETAGDSDPREALARLDRARAQAERIGHRGTVLAARVRSAALAAGHDAAAARAHARAALALHAAGVGTTALRAAELWLHCSAALAAAGDSGAEAVRAEGRRWLEQACAAELPAELHEAFCQRNPVHRALLAAAPRAAGSPRFSGAARTRLPR